MTRNGISTCPGLERTWQFTARLERKLQLREGWGNLQSIPCGWGEGGGGV